MITVDSSKHFQRIQGFRLNFTAPYFRDDQKAMFDMFIDDLGVQHVSRGSVCRLQQLGSYER